MRQWILLLATIFSLSCSAGATCDDGLRSVGEADVDCGGACQLRCAVGKRCSVASDCQSAVCERTTCAEARCNDGIKNGSETDADCGGGCAPCTAGASCQAAADCRSSLCTANRCEPETLTAVSPAKGPTGGGTVVTLRGNGLKTVGAVGVQFDGVAGSGLTIVDDSQLTIAAPPHTAAGKVDVTIQLSGNRSYTLKAAFTYYYGSVSFSEPTLLSHGVFCDRLTSGDLNQDGKPDLIMGCQPTFCDSSPSMLAVALGNGNGTFATPAYYALATCIGRMRVADFDGDGLPDVAATMTGSNGSSVAVLGSKGSGLLNSPVYHPVGGSPFGLVAIDLNGDDRPDLATANQYDSSISVLLNAGKGSFADQVEYPLDGAATFELASADFDGNGSPDIVVANLNLASLTVLLNNSNGVLTVARSITLKSPMYAIATADWNGDNIPDIAGSDANNFFNISLVQSNKNQTYGAPVLFPKTPNFDYYRQYDVVLADFNRDGIPDVAAMGYGPTDLSVQMITDKGAFGAALRVHGEQCLDVTTADFDGDGRVDIALACRQLAPPQVPYAMIFLNQSQ